MIAKVCSLFAISTYNQPFPHFCDISSMYPHAAGRGTEGTEERCGAASAASMQSAVAESAVAKAQFPPPCLSSSSLPIPIPSGEEHVHCCYACDSRCVEALGSLHFDAGLHTVARGCTQVQLQLKVTFHASCAGYCSMRITTLAWCLGPCPCAMHLTRPFAGAARCGSLKQQIARKWR